MAVTEVRLLNAGQRGSLDGSFTREYVQEWLVKSNDRNEDPGVVGLANLESSGGGRVPRLFERYQNPGGVVDLGAYVRKISVSQGVMGSPFLWVVTVDYSSSREAAMGGEARFVPADPAHPEEGGTPVQDPLLRPPELSFSPIESMRPVEFDAIDTVVDEFGDNVPKPITNAAGDPIVDPAPEAEHTDLALTISRYELAYVYDAMTPYFNCTNSVTWKGFAAGKVKCSYIVGSWDLVERVFLWRVTYQFKIREAGWKFKQQNRGMRQKVGGDFRPCVDALGVPVGVPVGLNLDGTQCTGTQTPRELEYNLYPQIDFTPLNL